MSDSYHFLRPSDLDIYADYERHTAETTDLLDGLGQDLDDKMLPERNRLFHIAQLACSLWEYRTRGIQEMTPEWQARRSRDRQHLRTVLSRIRS